MKDVIERKYVISSPGMDMDYHLTVSGLMVYIQDTVASYLSMRHLAAFDVIDDHLLWVITDFYVSVDERRPFWPDEVTVSLWCSERTSIKAYFDYRVKDSLGREFARGTSCWAIIDSDTRKPSLRTEEYLSARLTVRPEMVFGKHGKIAVPKPAEQLGSVDYRTLTSDIDFNGHISNRLYQYSALGCETLDFIRSHTPVSIHVRYVKETMHGDSIHSRMHAAQGDGSTHLYLITNDAGEQTCTMAIKWADQPVEPFTVREYRRNLNILSDNQDSENVSPQI